jgi:hypothetical protein
MGIRVPGAYVFVFSLFQRKKEQGGTIKKKMPGMTSVWRPHSFGGLVSHSNSVFVI